MGQGDWDDEDPIHRMRRMQKIHTEREPTKGDPKHGGDEEHRDRKEMCLNSAQRKTGPLAARGLEEVHQEASAQVAVVDKKKHNNSKKEGEGKKTENDEDEAAMRIQAAVGEKKKQKSPKTQGKSPEADEKDEDQAAMNIQARSSHEHPAQRKTGPLAARKPQEVHQEASAQAAVASKK